jgi:2-polyprenyl-3-methyl-5-hydroxy-6-metoxy-1,4-benzoquinol methylase
LFTGEIDHGRLRELYETSDVFVLPTYWVEGFPTVISEAMNAGLPIVTTRMRGMADHLHEDENALFVAPRAPEELGLTVERLLRDPELRARMGRANQEKVKLFAPEQAAAVYRAALTEIASGANGAAGGAAARSEQAPQIEEIRRFWEQNPCGNETSDVADRLEYFRGLERFRYDLAPWIPEAAGFDRYAGKRVLEIGCGMGTDAAQFAAAGAAYTGVDLTDAAVALARENFERRGLQGTFVAANAEHLPFPDDSFDHVYSFGVIHHTTRPAAIVDEIRRVLAPGGTVTVMLYNRNSINYRVEIMVLRKLGRLLLRPAWAPALLAKLLRLPRGTLEGHRRQLLRIAHPSHDEWVSMNTDGPDCPLARVYSAREVRSLFAGFDEVRTKVYMFDRRHWPLLGSLISDRMEGVIGRRVGWNRMTYATKRDT